MRYRVSYWGPLTAILIVSLWLLACIWVGWTGGLGQVNIPPALAACAALSIGLYWLYLLNDLRKAAKPEAWIAALGPDGVYINCRSYRNARGAAEESYVVLVPYAAIACAGSSVPPMDNGAATARSRCAELRLSGVDAAALEACLERERNAAPGASPLARVAWRESPVSLGAEGVLRIEWQARPSLREFLGELHCRGVMVPQWHRAAFVHG